MKNITIRRIAAIFGIVLLVTSCRNAQEVDPAAEQEKILELHRLQRTYHFEKMAEEFASLLSADHISVNRGEIRRPTQAENTERFNRYFNSVEFEKWDDISPPVVRFSDDYSMAYTIVHKDVVINYEDENGEKMRESTEFSWVAIYKKHPEGWKIDCVASTNKPGIVKEMNN